MKRSKFSLSHYKLFTCEMGSLIPICWFEALPGDTVQQASSALIRFSPLLAPVMHPVRVRIHHWFVPNRLLWDDWESFITGGPDGMDASVPPYFGAAGVTKGSLFDYLGIPPGATIPVSASALPIRAYQLIWNEFYRDQDLQAPAPIATTGGLDPGSTAFDVKQVGWEKDYFTTSRPWTQKGPEVTLPLAGMATVVSASDGFPTFTHAGSSPGGTWPSMIGHRTGERSVELPGLAAGATTTGNLKWSNPKLAADLSTSTAISVNELREAFAIQRYEEARARYGSRYTEYLRYLGVKSSDARLQRPEYLGGGKQTIQFSEVLQTAPDADAEGSTDVGVGDLKGHGIGAIRSNRYRRFFEEHGIVMSLMSVVPKTIYADGLPRAFARVTKEDYFQRELQHIGQQEVLNKEVYIKHASPEAVFGYQDRYDEYRRLESSIAGDFRDTLAHWHLARQFGSEPALNGSFIQADPSKRIFAEQTTSPLWVMANHSIQARRLVAGSARSFIA